jgi:hypothetical protein
MLRVLFVFVRNSNSKFPYNGMALRYPHVHWKSKIIVFRFSRVGFLSTLLDRTLNDNSPVPGFNYVYFLSFWRNSLQWVRASSLTRFLDHTQRRTTVGRTSLDEWSARRRDLNLTTHNTTDRHSCLRWDSNQQSQQASGLRPRGHWDRLLCLLSTVNTYNETAEQNPWIWGEIIYGESWKFAGNIVNSSGLQHMVHRQHKCWEYRYFLTQPESYSLDEWK